ncbi:MAG: hypothetical protein RL266_1845, partial [Bacteroidota bacterium]
MFNWFNGKMNDRSTDRKFYSLAPSAEMRSLLEHSDRSIIILDRDYRVLWFNSKASKDMFSFFKEELKTGSSYWDYVDESHNKRFIRNFQASLKGRTISVEQHIPKSKNASIELWIDGRFSPLYGKKGDVDGVIYSYQNISDKKKAEQESLAQANVLQAIDRNDSQGFILLDEDDRVISCNLMAPVLIATVDSWTDQFGKNIIECIHPYWKDEFEGGVKVARSGG